MTQVSPRGKTFPVKVHRFSQKFEKEIGVADARNMEPGEMPNFLALPQKLCTSTG
jgi:hypothetical protein